MKNSNRRIGESENRRENSSPARPFAGRRFADSPIRRLGCEAGQAMSELVIVLPLFLVLVGAAMMVTYMCWQGVKVQQAANLAARVQGQERLAGGIDGGNIDQKNGVGPSFGFSTGDSDPSDPAKGAGAQTAGQRSRRLPQAQNIDPKSVYGRYRDLVRKMFGDSERDSLYVPAPKIGNYSDTVKVIRVMETPSILGLNRMGPVTVNATAYGGEDPYMYALPRWGGTQDKPLGEWWKDAIKNNKGCPANTPNCR